MTWWLVQSGLGGRLMRLFSPQFEERRRIDELIESGKEEGMKVRWRAVGQGHSDPSLLSPFVATDERHC